MRRIQLAGCLALALAACKPVSNKPPMPDLSAFAVEPPAGALHRLSVAQYVNTIHDIVSPDIIVPTALEPDSIIDGFASVGLTSATISPTGVDRYEKAALAIAKQALSTDARKQALVGCQPSEQTCLTNFIKTFGRRAWRRPLTDEEVQRLATVGTTAATALSDPWQGIGAVLASMLQSPNFLFRVELGEPDAGGLRYTNHEMAGRLAAFLTGSTPDEALLAAADRGELVTDAGLRQQVRRLLDSPASRKGMRSFFTELLNLKELDSLSKDTNVFLAMSADLGPAAREETLRDLENIVFDTNADYRTFFTGRSTFVNRRLAAVYDVATPSLDGFSAVTLPADGARVGFLGQVSFLALQSHPTTTSPVLRGKFVRTVLLCDKIAPPPAGVNTGLLPITATIRTMRDRAQAHLEQASYCAGCHRMMDPIGLGLENFDGIGKFRTLDNGVTIDASGDIDGKRYTTPEGLAQTIVSSPKFPACFGRKMFEYAAGSAPTPAQDDFVKALGEAFVKTDYRVKDMMEIVAMSSGFRRAGAPQ